MTNKELIEKLSVLDPDGEAIICIKSSNPELQQAYVPIAHAHITQAVERKENFRDMMDGTNFETKVWRFQPDAATNIIVLMD